MDGQEVKDVETTTSAPDVVVNSSKNVSPVVTRHESVNSINLLNPEDVAKAEVFLKRMLKTDKGGIKTIEDGLAIMMRAQDLGLPFSTCLEHIHVINGKTGVDIHIIKALLSKAGVTWSCLNDYTPQYEYTDGINAYVEDKLPDYAIRCKSIKEAQQKAEQAIKDGDTDSIFVYPVRYYQGYDGNIYKDYQINSNFAVALNKQHAQQLIAQKKIPIYRIPAIPIDYITRYEFHRTVGGKEITSIGSFSYSEAVAADCFTKDTYKKYPKVMVGHRAFTYGARDIASDVLFGVMETTELRVVSGQELRPDDIDYEEVQIVK